MTDSTSYPVSDRNRVRRAHERGRYDRETVHAILDAAMLAHIAYVIEGQPFCTPTVLWREDDTLYWHGSAASRMLKQARDGLRACVTVAHLDGLVLARSGFHHSVNYRSAMCFGTARLVVEAAEKGRAFDALIDRFYPGRSAEIRPATAQELKATSIVAMPIEEAAAKIRAKGVVDDEEDYGLPVWAGVIPVETVTRPPEDCPRLAPGETPGASLAGYLGGGPIDAAFLEAQRRYENV